MNKILFLNLPFWGKGMPYKEAGGGVGFTRKGGSNTRWYKSKHITPILDMMNAATILQREGHDIKVYDAQFCRTENFDALFEHLKAYATPTMILIRTALPTINNDIRIVKQLKKKWPNAIFAVFGPCFYSDYVVEYVKRYRLFDLIVSSEIEAVIKNVYDKMEECDAPGVYRKKESGYISSDPKRLLSELDAIPPVDYSLIDYKKLDRFFLQTTKGCPVSCRFCPYYLTQGSKFRVKSIEKVIEDIQFVLDKFGKKTILFRDPNFSFLRQRTIQFCNSVLEKTIDFEWNCETDLHRLEPDDLELMAKAGCSSISFGVESANLVSMKNSMRGKPPQVEILKKNIKKCRESGIKTRAMYILGIKGDSLESIIETIKLSGELKADISAFGLPNFYPGSNLFDEALAEGRIPDIDNFEEAAKYFETISNQSTPPLVYVHGLEIEDLELLRDLAFYTNLARVSPLISKPRKMIRKYKIKKRLSERLSVPIRV